MQIRFLANSKGKSFTILGAWRVRPSKGPFRLSLQKSRCLSR